MYYGSEYDSLPRWQREWVDEAVADGWYWVNSGSAGRVDDYGDVEYPQMIVSPELMQEDCMGRFCAGFANNTIVYYYERSPEEVGSRSYSCGNVPGDRYDLDAMIDKANTCPECHAYCGADNMYHVGRDGKACPECAAHMRKY